MLNQTFGPFSAERDSELLQYFHKTEFIHKLLLAAPGEGPFLLLSRPGAGKTALKKWLLSDESPYDAIALDANKGRVFVDDPEFNDEDYRALLRAELLSGVLGELIIRKPKLPKKRTKEQEQLYNEAENCLENGWWAVATSFFSDRFAGLQILGCGFNLHKDQRRQYLDKIRRNDVSERALSALRALIATEDRNFCLIGDNPEHVVGQGGDLIDRANALRIGALLNVLAEIYSTSLRVVVFTKFHIFDSIQDNYTDYSHFADGVARLEWTDTDLLEFVRLRVEKRFRAKWNQVFTVGEKTFAKNVLPWLVNGPRDLLFLLALAQSSASGGRVSEEDLLKASTQLRDEKYKEMSRLFGGVYPGIDAFCRAAVTVVRALNPPLTTKGVDAAIDAGISDPNGPLHGIRRKYDWVINVQAGAPRASSILGILARLFS
jgi:hypothetical protein